MTTGDHMAMRFALSAALVVAIGTAVTEHVTPDTGPFGKPPLMELIGVLAGGTLVWSYVVAALAARLVRGSESASTSDTLIAGAAFAFSTPALGFALQNVPFVVNLIVLGAWVVAFPVFSVRWMARRTRSPNMCLERPRS